MKKFVGDIFNHLEDFDAVVVTTNGFVKSNGRCVMGAGIAKQVRDKIRDTDLQLGRYIKQYGNRVFNLGHYTKKKGTISFNLISLPVKHNWWEDADVDLIAKSLSQLIELVDKLELTKVAVPYPGIGNGKLSKDVVAPLLEVLDDRFIVCTLK